MYRKINDQDVCAECGSVVSDENKHNEWHNRIDRLLRWSGDPKSTAKSHGVDL